MPSTAQFDVTPVISMSLKMLLDKLFATSENDGSNAKAHFDPEKILIPEDAP